MRRRAVASTRRIIAVAHDIGGAQAISPVIAKLRSKPNLQVDVIAGHFAQKTFARFHPENASSDWSEAEIDEYLQKSRADLVLSGTSWKSRLEQGFRNRAHLRGIPSVVVIDFWSNYRLRWHDASYRFEEGLDQVCIMDAQAAAAMSNEGYPKQQLFVTGQPHLERCYLRGARQKPPFEGKGEIKVLFLTISLVALGLEYDPIAPIRIICHALERWHAATKLPVSLTIRPHPHENPEPDFLDRLQALSPLGVRIRFADRTKPILGQLRKSDVILGYITMGLFEARTLGKQAIAIRLANHPPELVAAMEDAGIPLLPFDADQIASFLCRPAGPDSALHRNTHRGAAAAVAKLCLDLVARRNNREENPSQEVAARSQKNDRTINRVQSVSSVTGS